MNSCKINISHFLEKEFDHWQGLKDTCSLSELSTFIQFNEGEGKILLGQKYKPAVFKTAFHDNYPDLLQFHFENDSLIQIAAERPGFNSKAIEKLISQLGEPDFKLDFYWKIQVITEGEWVYAKKGLAIYFNTDQTNIIRITGFRSTNRQGYIDCFYNLELYREY